VIRSNSIRLLLLLLLVALAIAALNGGWAWDEYSSSALI
jgi:hypothetical protein